jgi:hypothetical protein
MILHLLEVNIFIDYSTKVTVKTRILDVLELFMYISVSLQRKMKHLTERQARYM